jgi:hypothetical protein
VSARPRRRSTHSNSKLKTEIMVSVALKSSTRLVLRCE